MTNMTKPEFIIKNNPQKGGYLYSDILTPNILKDVCKRVTGCIEYTCKFDNTGYNKGRLALIKYRGITNYISFSETGKIKGRNYFFQSLTTALIRYYSDKASAKRIYFYFLPLSGSISSRYFMLMYRLMATAGVKFLNTRSVLGCEIIPFNSVDDIITARDKNKIANSSNNSTYITRGSEGITQIYGKTYGASKKETALLCIAISQLSQKIELYEICEQSLCELPKPDLKIIKSLGNTDVIPTNLTMEKIAFEENNSLRSPRFNYNLLEKLGPKKCAFCKCEIPELIEGAHIFPVNEIKQLTLDIKSKIKLATDRDNGIWLCENHHKMLDENFLRITESGQLKCKSNIKKKSKYYINDTTTINQIENNIMTPKFIENLQRRNELISESNYILFNR